MNNNTGVTINYNILEIGFFKVIKEGAIGNQKWNNSIRIRTSNLIQVEDDELGLVDKEQFIEFIINCENKTELAVLNKLFRVLKEADSGIQVRGTLPLIYDYHSIMYVRVTDTPIELIKKYLDVMKKNKLDTKAS